MKQRLIIFFMGLGLAGAAANARPATHPPVPPRRPHAADPHSPHVAASHPVPHHDLAYKPKKAKNFKLGKPGIK